MTASNQTAADPTRRDEQAGSSRQVRVGALLVMLVAVAMLPPLAFSAFLLERNNTAQREALGILAEAATGAAVETVERQLAGMRTSLRGLATSQSLQSGDFKTFYDNAHQALEGTQSFLIVVDETMQQLVNTRVPFGTALGKISDPGPVQLALGGGETIVSDGFRGTVAKRWVFNVIQPWHPVGASARALILTQDSERLGPLLSSENLRGGWNAVIVDSKGIILASSLMASDAGKPFFLAQAVEAGGPSRGSTFVDGERYDFVSKVSPSSGWRVVLWATGEMVQQSAARTLRLLLLGGLGMVAVGGLAAWLLSRRIAASVRTLAADARKLGESEDVPARTFPVMELSSVSQALADASIARREADNEIRFLMREVAHRSKNQLTVVTSFVKQSARNTKDVQALSESFQHRVMGLARSTDLLIAGSIAGVDLAELLAVQIEPFRPGDAESLTIAGPSVRLSPQAAQTLGLALHELATNAAKYGALADVGGRLAVTWRIDGDMLSLRWRETTARTVEQPSTEGFGSQLIDRMFGTLHAEIQRAYHSDGLELNAAIPVDSLRQGLKTAPPA